MLGFIQPLPDVQPQTGAPPCCENASASRVLAISSDTAFYAAVMGAIDHAGCQIEWARSFRRAFELCIHKTVGVVIYDGNLPGIEWEWAFMRLAEIPRPPRLLLAASSVDEDLWRDVLRRRGYDVVERSGGPAAFRRALRFARLSLAPDSAP